MDHCITRYQPSAADAGNPYLDEVLRLIGDIRSSGAADVELELLSHREELVAKYAFSIPTAGALAAIAAYSPLIEIGAGTGYWARCLSLAGADIIAFDSRVPGAHSPWEWSAANAWFDDTWFYVEEGDEATAALYPERSLFLAWPPPDDPMALRALEQYRRAGGRTLIYLGNPASSGDAAFHRELSSLRTVESRRIWGWPFVEDRLSIHHL